MVDKQKKTIIINVFKYRSRDDRVVTDVDFKTEFLVQILPGRLSRIPTLFKLLKTLVILLKTPLVYYCRYKRIVRRNF